MKKTATLLLLLFVSIAFAQIPPGYYATATGTGYTLKTQLYNIIKNNTNTTSHANYGDLWTLYTQSAFRDHYYENDNSLMDVYSEKPAGADAYQYTSTGSQCGNYTAEGSCYNREHVMPQSVFGQDNYPMYSDAHYLLPTDGYVNNKRDNFPYGRVNSATYTSTNGSKLGQNMNSGYSAGYSGVVFEPIDEFKGDIARALLYFATRYETQVTGWSYTMFNGTSTQVYTDAFKNILLTWNDLDPVSPYEIAKNNAVYVFQNNRNPYIDHPEYVHTVWGPTLATQDFDLFTSVSVYPNPANDHKINIESENTIEDIQLITINGQIMLEIKNPVLQNHTYTLENLPQGFYFVKLTANNQSTTKKIIVN